MAVDASTNLERILDRSTMQFLPVQIPVPDKPRDLTLSPGWGGFLLGF